MQSSLLFYMSEGYEWSSYVLGAALWYCEQSSLFFGCLKAMIEVARSLGLYHDAVSYQAYCFIYLKALNQVAMYLGLYYDAACNQAFCFICLKAMNQVARCLGLHHDSASNHACFVFVWRLWKQVSELD